MRGTRMKRLSCLFLLALCLPLAAECAKKKPVQPRAEPEEPEQPGRAWFGVASIPSGKKGAQVKLNDDDNKVVHLKQVALAGGKGSAHVSIDVNGKSYFLGKVNGKESQFRLNLPVDDSFALKQTGSGSVSVTGFKVTPGGDDSDEDKQGEIEFWGLTVPAKKKASVKLNDEADERVHITQVALGPKAKSGSQAVVTITVDGGRKAVLGTLDADKNPHFEVNLWVDDSFKVSHTGDSPVYLTGYYMGDTDTGSEEEEEEFWTAAVQPGKALTVSQKDEDDVTTHLTQVALGPTKSSEPVTVTIDVNGESHVLGTLIKGVVTEFAVDLPIDDTFTLSHNGKGVQVYVSGYTTSMEQDEQVEGGAKGGKAAKKKGSGGDDEEDDEEVEEDDEEDEERGGDDDDGDDDEDEDGDGGDDDDDDDEPIDEEDEDGDGEPEADFWGISVPKGRKVTVPLDDSKDEVVHIKQIALAPGKPGATTVFLDVNGQRLFLGTLNSKTVPQFAVDLVVDDTFTFSHSGTGTVHVLGFSGELEKPLEPEGAKGEPELESEVWNERIAPGKALRLGDLRKGESLHITQISLGPNSAAGDTSLTFETGGRSFAIGTLNRAGQPQAKVSALLRSPDDVVKCSGTSIVYLTGYTERFEKDEDGAGAAGGDDDDDDDDEEDDDEEECTGKRCPKKGKAAKKPEKKGKKSKQADDDDDDDDDDDGEDEGPLLNGPRIVSSFCFGIFTLWWFGFFKEDPEKAAAEAAKAAAKRKAAAAK